jgi:RNA polymerase sigma-70 factor (ECF subfamily)
MAEALTDSQLVARCRAGDEQAWAELVQRFSRYVYAISVQAFRPWLAQLTRRLCIDRLRATSRERPAPEEDLEAGTEETLSTLEDALTVHEALAAVPEHCREILDRFFAQDESYKTIGAALDLPAGTIASRISRCLTRLREHLEGRTGAVPPSSAR